MTGNKKEFGNFLREMISQTKISQADFYTAVGITKPYFYDILSGRVKPPPPDIQYRMLEGLKLSEKQKKQFLDLAAEGRREIPADIVRLITENPQQLEKIRSALAALLLKQ